MQQLMRGVARVVAFSAAVGITAGAIAADPKLPTTPIGTLQDRALVSIAGTITHAFGNRFVLQDDSGHVLVDTGPSWFASRTFAVGERLTVHGRIDGLEFEAREIVRPDGSKESIRPDRGPPHWAGGPKAHGAVGRH